MESHSRELKESEFSVLERYGVRWAVLAAWHTDLAGRGVAFEAGFDGKLDTARTEIATGTYSSRTIGCDLGGIEGALVSMAATFDPASVDSWLEKLGHAMSRPDEVRNLIGISAIQTLCMTCGFLPCNCKE
jgi:hypothetical protein